MSPRPATEDDVEAMVSLEKKVQVLPWGPESFEGELDKPYSHTLLLTDDETDELVFGYVVFWVLGDECEILNLAVDPTVSRRGLARGLVNRVVTHALQGEATKVKLNVRVDNQPAIQFYQKCGFASTHRRASFYSDGMDAYQMDLDLTDSESIKAFRTF